MSTRASCSLWPLGWHNGSRATQAQTQPGSYTSTQLRQTQLPYKHACGTTNSSTYVWEDWTLTDTSAYKAFFHCRFRPDKVVLGILMWLNMGWHLDIVDSYFRAKVRVGGDLLAQKGGKSMGCSHSLDEKHGKWHVHRQVRIPFGVSLESLHRAGHLLLCQASIVANRWRGQSVLRMCHSDWVLEYSAVTAMIDRWSLSKQWSWGKKILIGYSSTLGGTLSSDYFACKRSKYRYEKREKLGFEVT